MFYNRKLLQTLLILFLIFSNSVLTAQAFDNQDSTSDLYKIDYYGVVSAEIDDNIYKMTSDLYFTQLSEINNLSISDKRKDVTLVKSPETSELSDTNLSFFAVIEKKQNSTTWIATLNLVDRKHNITKTSSKEYDSYYKILMEPKHNLQESIKELITSNSLQKSDKQQDVIFETDTASTGNNISSLELLAGTWAGETGISKIVIMRGGRGFVIFENGASMNVTLEVSYDKGYSQLIVTQNGKSNASFFPDIPRNLALSAALNCEPIKWTLSLIDDNNLEGTKDTLVLKDEKAVFGTVSVSWTKR